MTRRAPTHPLQTLGRGVDRMAPGGRRSASESPVVRSITPIRKPKPVTTPPTPPELLGEGGMDAATGRMFWFANRLPGDVLVSVVLTQGTTLTPPAGWTVLASGSMVGDPRFGSTAYRWHVAWGVSAGGPGGGPGVGNEGTNGGVSAANSIGHGFSFRTPLTPTLAGSVVNVGPSATSITLPSAGSVVQPVQSVIVLPNGPPGMVASAGAGLTWSPPTTADLTGTWKNGSPTSEGKYLQIVQTYPPGVHPGNPQVLTTICPCSLTAFAWGFS